MKYDAVLFDFDGTIAETGEGIFNGIRRALELMGVTPPEDEKLRYFVGPPLQESFSVICGFDNEQSTEAIRLYREYYAETGIYELHLYDGMEQLFRKLKDAGVKLAVASAKPEIYLKKIVERFGMSDLFEGIAGTDLKDRHADKSVMINRLLKNMDITEVGRVLMVGDRFYDIEGAKKAGVDSAGVLFGYGSREELEKAGADFLVSSADELFDIVLGN